MTTMTASKARSNLYRLLDKAAVGHEAIQITGRRHNGILVSEEDWRSIQETLHLLSIPGMRESLIMGKKTPLSRCRSKLSW